MAMKKMLSNWLEKKQERKEGGGSAPLLFSFGGFDWEGIGVRRESISC